ncbi:hypothetical protein ABE137_00050 [Brevibacillus laterosporus]|uniref:hypothetical protein n=1 Tax=Brevibacillus laterosporus TaxID=1465 RepID=UPI003D1BCB48
MNAFETGQKIVKATDNVIDTTKTTMNSIGEVVGKVYTSARNVIANGIDKIANWVKLVKQQMKKAIMTTIKGIKNGINAVKRKAQQLMKKMRKNQDPKKLREAGYKYTKEEADELVKKYLAKVHKRIQSGGIRKPTGEK